jgi:hypothetical protein
LLGIVPNDICAPNIKAFFKECFGCHLETMEKADNNVATVMNELWTMMSHYLNKSQMCWNKNFCFEGDETR